MRWPTCSTLSVVIVAFATALCSACKSKQTTLDLTDFQQKTRVSAAHQRLSLDDTISFFRFCITDSDTATVPVAQMIRRARASRTSEETDTAAATSRAQVQKTSSYQNPGELPGWLSNHTYLLIKSLLFIVLVAYIARKL